MSIIEKLTEGVINRDLSRETNALLNKWSKTGLLEGIESDHGRNSMACLLENQAKELLREASTMAGGDVEGFAAVAFPIVRRVFGGLVANELVSVQPMSLPSGLIFFLDFTYGNNKLAYEACTSVYGGGVVGAGLINGVDLSPEVANSFYNLNNGYSSPTGSVDLSTLFTSGHAAAFSIEVGNTSSFQVDSDVGGNGTVGKATLNGFDDMMRMIQFDPDLPSGSIVGVYQFERTLFDAAGSSQRWNFEDCVAIQLAASALPAGEGKLITVAGYEGQQRRLTGLDSHEHTDSTLVNFVVEYSVAQSAIVAGPLAIFDAFGGAGFPIIDNFQDGSALGSIVGAPEWGLEGLGGEPACSNSNISQAIAEIDIKVDSTAITAITKKLRCKWTPELQQDINAYHNLDAEVELTSILSETIALEIDQEILEDLIKGATASTFHWSRRPGKFVDRLTGLPIQAATPVANFPDFTGTVSEWYETLLETVNDVSAQIHRKTLRGGANFIVTSPEVANLLEFTSGFRASTTADENKGTAGAVNVGSISKKWDVYVDPYFPRNLLLVGRKGSSFLESGYVYAPYVPLQTTPTIFDPENFTPRKGVMTRYGKKMVRPDMYGLVVVEDLLG
jgi:hypothetical protein